VRLFVTLAMLVLTSCSLRPLDDLVAGCEAGPCHPSDAGKPDAGSKDSGVPDAGPSASCTDGIRNGHESDIDCGGGACPGCVYRGACRADSDCASGSCGPDNKCRCPTDMILVMSLYNTWYCIDATEVTQAAYANLLARCATPDCDAGLTDPSCGWNTSLIPGTATGPCATPSFDPTTYGAYPVTCVDWCDAQTYCRSIGRHLCGRVTGNGANSSFAQFADPAQSEWFHACSAGNNRIFPYGNTYLPDDCNGYDYDAGGLIPVASLPMCVGSLPGLYDLSGNATEWEASCNAEEGATDLCRVRGGSYNNVGTDIQCDADNALERDDVEPDVSFRCCVGN
jgi:hypothetical protein